MIKLEIEINVFFQLKFSALIPAQTHNLTIINMKFETGAKDDPISFFEQISERVVPIPAIIT